MKILHTADWHIGHRLYERTRIDEHDQFLAWLIETIRQNAVDVLLVAGDIFDTALPSSEATNLYYQFLFQLYRDTSAHAVIIAGNHDSPLRLTAPREFLKMGRIHVVGGAPPQDYVMTLQNGESAVSIAAVPYLSENEILPHVSLEPEIQRTERYREAMRQLYQQCVAQMPPEAPKILIGHLVVQGAVESGSERPIQIGGATAIRAGDLPEGATYMALGHLHRPQRIDGAGYPVQYAGSPLPMTFKEATYPHSVYLIDVTPTGESQVTTIPIPVFKVLERVEGNYDEALFKANSADEDWNGKYIEVRLILDVPRVGVGDEIRDAFAARGGDVLLVEVQLSEQQRQEELTTEDITAKAPEDIFAEFYRDKYSESAEHEARFSEIMRAFKELAELVSASTQEE